MRNAFKLKSAMFVLAASFMMTGCFTQRHVIGEGAQTGDVEEVRQWYVLWGLVPINDVDSAELANGAYDYEIKTEHNALDVIIGIFTGVISVYPRTVTITR
ncbi:MAG: hypothetical protein BMS9Abin05_0530 [Rhodothermia bacterium]|nr:MAG: hypothetical protein BMS9Abin05_0530 [Rhodothermia bacterium]